MRIFAKAVVIDEPWLSKILAGEKVWEMRSKRTRYRGAIGLIRKGSGHIVGMARLAECLTALSPLDFARHEAEHRIPPSQQDEALRRRWHFPWVLEEARALPHPVPYSHRSGQMVWVRLDASVDLAIQQTLQITQVRVRSDKGRESPAVREHR